MKKKQGKYDTVPCFHSFFIYIAKSCGLVITVFIDMDSVLFFAAVSYDFFIVLIPSSEFTCLVISRGTE